MDYAVREDAAERAEMRCDAIRSLDAMRIFCPSSVEMATDVWRECGSGNRDGVMSGEYSLEMFTAGPGNLDDAAEEFLEMIEQTGSLCWLQQVILGETQGLLAR